MKDAKFAYLAAHQSADNMHHTIFYEFEEKFKTVSRKENSDFLGAVYDSAYAAPQGSSAIPQIDDEYFEWLNILCSAIDAKEKYTFVELGAGYGRWCARAFNAAKLCGISSENIYLIGVEAEPQHAIWFNEHMMCNHIPNHSVVLHEALISDNNEIGEIVVTSPQGLTSFNWYGQAKQKNISPTAIAGIKTYMGRELFVDKGGWGRIRCQTLTLETLLKDHDLINVIDMDVQGEELNIVKNSIKILNEKVMRLFIGTHSNAIDRELSNLLSTNKWTCVNNYDCGKLQKTPYGMIEFQDGVQYWVNPKFPNQTI